MSRSFYNYVRAFFEAISRNISQQSACQPAARQPAAATIASSRVGPMRFGPVSPRGEGLSSLFCRPTFPR